MARLLLATFNDGTTERVITWSAADSEELMRLHEDNPDVIVWTVEREGLTKEECEIFDTPAIRVKYDLPKEYRDCPRAIREEER